MTDDSRQPALESPRERIKRLFKNTGIYGIGEVVIALLGVALLPIITHKLSPAEYGIWSLGLMVLYGFTILCNPALNGAVSRFFYDHEHDEPRKRRFQGTVFSLLMLWSLGLCVLTTLIGPWLFDALFVELPFWPYGALVVWMTFLTMFGVIPRAVWVAAERPASFVGIKLLGSTVEMLGQLGLVVIAGIGVLGMFYGRAASLLVLAIPFVIYTVRHIQPAWSWDDLRSALRFSLPLVPHLAAHWVLGMADRFLIERHYARLDAGGVTEADFGLSGDASLSLAAVGIYGVAYYFLNAINLVSMAMNQAWVPQFTRSQGQPEERGFVARSITYFILAVASMSTAVIVLGPPLVRLLLEDRYAYVAELIPILALGGLFQGLYYVFVAVLFYHKENRLIPVITVVSGTINVVLNLLWLPGYGLVGACWATAISYTILMLGVRWASRRHPMPDFETSRLLRIAAVLLVVTIAGLLLEGGLPVAWEVLAKLGLLGLGAAALWKLGLLERR